MIDSLTRLWFFTQQLYEMARMMPAKSASKTHRALELLDMLRRVGGSARTSHLAAALDVSEETIRRTVKKLSKEGLVVRVHGGVFLAEGGEPGALPSRLGRNRAAKREMARRAADMVRDGASLFMDVGSSTAYVAEALRRKEGLTVVTNSMTVAQTLMGHNGNRVFLAGGEAAAGMGGCFGATAQEFVCRFHTDLAILSADAVDPERGFLLNDFAEAELTRCYIRQSRRRIIVADHSKFSHTAPVAACAPGEIDILVTDRPPPPALARALAGWEVKVSVANGKGAA